MFQPPGERNALGRIRFNFPNKFLVYQHDTPEKHYFAHDKRAYSHGCMRVQDPMKYAEVLLSLRRRKATTPQDSLKRMFGGEERQIDFAQHIPVHISYQTAFVDDAGKLQFRDDVYGLDSTLMAHAQGQRARGGRRLDRAAGRPQLQADPAARPAHEQRRPRRQPVLAVRAAFPVFLGTIHRASRGEAARKPPMEQSFRLQDQADSA